MAVEIFLASVLGDIHLTSDLVAGQLQPNFDLGFLFATIDCDLPDTLEDAVGDHQEAGRQLMLFRGKWPLYSLQLEIRVATQESDERLQHFADLVEGSSLLFQTLKRAGVPIETSWRRAEDFYS